VQSEPNNTTDEFSPVLRRYLREQAAIECAGFDADLASAYLEQALTALACRQFEDHLTACPPCRQHLWQLAQLAQQAVLVMEPERVPIAPPLPVPGRLERWREQARQWFRGLREGIEGVEGVRRPAFGLVAPAGLAALAILVGAGIVWQFRPVGEVTDQASSNQVEIRDSALTRPETLQNGSASLAQAPEDGQLAAVTGSVATRGSQAGPAAALKTAGTPGASGASRPGSQPAGESAPRGEAEEAIALQLPIRPRIAAVDQLGIPRPTLQLDQAEQFGQSGLMTVTNIQGGKAAAASRERNPFNSPGPFAGYGGVISNSFAGSVRSRSRDNGGSESIPVASVKMFRDKTFVFNGRFWVDQLSRELMTSRGTIDLVYGDEKFQQLVSEYPPLAGYFELRPVIVVWNGKIYRVNAR
jgi:hypothetical protein